jgi:predicted small secreted protein
MRVASFVKLSVLAAALAAAGCNTMKRPGAGADDAMRAQQLEEREAALKQREAELAARSAGGDGLTPPNARPGECYAKVFTEPVYKTQSKQVLKRAASEKVDVTPAKYGPVEEKVLVKPASKRVEVIPAEYEWVEERVMVKPASKRLEAVPAEYETVSEQVLVQAATTMWKRSSSAIPGAKEVKPADAAGEVLCLVEVPAVYNTVTKQVVKKPASTREVEIPAEFSTVKKQVLKRPATTREIDIPAEYQTVTVNKVVEPAKEVRTPMPAEYDTVNETVKVADSKLEWRPILCEVNATSAKIAEIQSALKTAGFDPGAAYGQLGASTFTAVQRYQTAKGLPVDKGAYINADTVKSLGLALK